MRWGVRGQVTLFVILGIFILALIGLTIYMKSVPQQEQLQKEVTEVIPGEFQPVKQFVERCVFEIGKEALVKAGQHGGHVDPVKSGVISIPEFPTQGSGVELAPGSNIDLPYWFYMRSSDSCKNNCVFDSLRPPLSRIQGANSVEEQVDKYIEEHVNACLDGFKPFKDQFAVKETGKIKVTTTIADEGVSFFVKYPLEVSRNKIRQQVSEYQAQLPLNFKEMYDVSSLILEAVQDRNIRFFERLTLSVIGAYGLGKDPLIPPMEGGTRLGVGSPKIWEKRKVIKEIQSLLADNIPVVDVLGSLNGQIVLLENNPTFNGIYNNYHITLDTIPPLNLDSKSIEFDYLDWWPMYLDLPQAKGEIIMPDSVMSLFLIPIGIQNFDFTYDMSFPVAVRIHDVDSLNGEGFTFQYAFEVNVRNNRPMESFSGPEGALQGSLFCDANKRNSGKVRIQTKSVEGKPLGEVAVSFSCADESCFIGRTDEFGFLETSLPICMDGLLSGSKEDFYGPNLKFSTGLGEAGSATLVLDRIVPLEASALRLPVKKKPFKYELDKWNDGIEWELTSSGVPLRKDEKAVVVLERVQGAGEEPFLQVLQFEGDEKHELKLTPGLYNYEAYTFVTFGPGLPVEKIVLQNRSVCYDTAPLIPFCCDECAEIPAFELNESFMEGNVKLESSTSGPIEVTSGNLGKKVVFGLPGVDLTDVKYHEDLLVMQAIENMSVSSRAALLPRFS
ncbi:MAG: hypothetical protein AABX70_01140 [Nanoarchaeota archaeon]